MPTIWATLTWDGERYQSALILPEPGTWYFRIGSYAPVPDMLFDIEIGYGGQRYPFEVLPAATQGSATSQPLSWAWMAALIVPVLLVATILLALSRRKKAVCSSRAAVKENSPSKIWRGCFLVV